MNKLLCIGALSPLWWTATLLIFGALEPNYNHLYNAVSELGAFGASNSLAMNLVCLLATGLMVIAAGAGLVQFLLANKESSKAGYWLIILGIMLGGAAVPADMELYFQSYWTLAHAFFVIFAIFPFFIAAFLTHQALKKLGMSSIFVSLWPLSFIPIFSLHGFLEQGGLVQRLTILIVLIWVSGLTLHLYRVNNSLKSKEIN